eukprot:scaffold108666_cov51-Phaeocystis_antarctica.AAC.1
MWLVRLVRFGVELEGGSLPGDAVTPSSSTAVTRDAQMDLGIEPQWDTRCARCSRKSVTGVLQCLSLEGG